jgi:hypothetical protein
MGQIGFGSKQKPLPRQLFRAGARECATALPVARGGQSAVCSPYSQEIAKGADPAQTHDRNCPAISFFAKNFDIIAIFLHFDHFDCCDSFEDMVE